MSGLVYWTLSKLNSSSVLRDALSTGSELSSLIGGQPVGSSGADTFKDALWRLSRLRHAAVHRCPVSILIIRDMLVDACRICWGLSDTERFDGITKALREIKRLVGVWDWSGGDDQRFRIGFKWLDRLGSIIAKLKGEPWPFM